MSPIPWAAILTHGPTIVAAARSLLATQSRHVDERQQTVDTRLDQLEKASVETARLLQATAEQLQAVTAAQQELQRRLRITLAVSIIAAVLSIGALIASFTL